MIARNIWKVNNLSAVVGVFALFSGAEFLVVEALGAGFSAATFLLGEVALVARPVSLFQAFEDRFYDIRRECHGGFSLC